jgi:hypothetical protein
MTKFGDGCKRWNLLNGDLHREDGPAIESVYGNQWWIDNRLHRIDGPADDRADGTKWWYLEGNIHRADGPAIEEATGHKEWCLHGRYYTFDRWLDRNTEISDEEKVMLKLKYG